MKKSVEQTLKEAIASLEEIKTSGYWPFASPAPCSTEEKIKEGIEQALRGLDKALFFHEEMFGKTGRDPMKCVSMTVIERVKP